ncbi:response regulator [Paenibacillus sp. 1P07SE]|uniref:response regulator n=1 Tax=Paenibacillus sp. 1P07SE TaxID=3132209 RepID=UPI0039A69DC6
MIRVVLAEDQPLMQMGLKTIIDLEADMEVVGTAWNGEEALQLCLELQPDLILLDIQMPVMNGIDCARQLKQALPDSVVLMLTTYADDDMIIESLLSGAVGYMLKDMAGDKLLAAIRDAARGEYMLPSVIAAKLAQRLHRMAQWAPPSETISRLKSSGIAFTDREREIIRLMLQGRTNRQIAEMLYMQVGTVKNYVSNIYAKIGSSDRSQAVRILRELTSP